MHVYGLHCRRTEHAAATGVVHVLLRLCAGQVHSFPWSGFETEPPHYVSGAAAAGTKQIINYDTCKSTAAQASSGSATHLDERCLDKLCQAPCNLSLATACWTYHQDVFGRNLQCIMSNTSRLFDCSRCT
jgi:hypothetical protein